MHFHLAQCKIQRGQPGLQGLILNPIRKYVSTKGSPKQLKTKASEGKNATHRAKRWKEEKNQKVYFPWNISILFIPAQLSWLMGCCCDFPLSFKPFLGTRAELYHSIYHELLLEKLVQWSEHIRLSPFQAWRLSISGSGKRNYPNCR